VLRACAALGCCVRRGRADPARLIGARAAARALHRVLAPGHIAWISGPSGAGKSTLLRALAAEARARRGRVLRPPSALAASAARAVIDLVPGPLDDALAALARAGLADAALLVRTPSELSEGERARLALAWAFARTRADGRRALLLLDEFASTLDRPAACRAARALRRWASRTGLRVVVATAHDDLAPHLVADWRVRCADNAWGVPIRAGGDPS
jgi:ABC-type ATPase with predicted acetyltransferase domain